MRTHITRFLWAALAGLLLPMATPGLGHLTNVYRIRLMQA
ncbi:MAG: hypothetical protein ACI89X_002724 [Planctomycetota bacterium]|jgi:hypothetical protein